MDKKEAYKILGVSENATPREIKKARDRLAKIHHTDKGGSNDEIQKINMAYDVLTKDGSDSSDIDEDAIWLMKQKIENALNYNNVSKEEMDDETVSHYEEKLRKCKTKEDLEKFTSEVVFFIQIYARARNAGYFDKKGGQGEKPKATPTTETRSDTSSSTNAKKYPEFTCDYCKLKVGSDDPRPKYTFSEHKDKAFCSEFCRTAWSDNDNWWKDWNEKKKKEDQEWADYKRKQDQKWNDYFRNMNSNNYSSYSSYTYTPSSSGSSGSSLSSWLDEYKKSREKQKSEGLEADKKQYIRDVEFQLSLKSVAEEKLNKKLGVSNWRGKINECSDSMEAWSRKFNMEGLIDKLSREYTCARCGTVKDNYYPWEEAGKKYCSLDCKNGVGDINSDEAKKLKKEIQELKDCLKKLNKDPQSLLIDVLGWIKKEGIVSIYLDLNSGKLMVEYSSGEAKTLEDSNLTLGQKGIKKYFQKSTQKSLSRNELEKMVNGNLNEEKGKNDRAVIGGMIMIVVITLAIIIGLAVYKKNKKRNY